MQHVFLAGRFSVCSHLYIARASDPPIIRYNPEDQSTMSFSYDGSAQSISFDEYDNVIYWANFVDAIHKVMKTLANEETVDLNITYSGEIEVTSDVFNLYVADKENNRIDKYLKASLEKFGNITYDVGIQELIVAYGESRNVLCITHLLPLHVTFNSWVPRIRIPGALV